MFNKNNTVRNYLLQFVLWAAIYALWVSIFHGNTLTLSRTASIQFCYLVFVALNYYLSVYYFVPRFLQHRKYYQFLLASFIAIIITSWMRAEVAVFISSYFYHSPIGDFTNLYLNSLLNIFIWSEVLIGAKIIFDRIWNQQRSLQLESEKVKNELNFLRAQNNPHFLFNSLNSLYFQIDKTNPEARETLLKLSEILRYQLYECAAEKIDIGRELEFLRNYVELQKLRLSSNYNVELTTGEDVKGFTTAPLLIMPLIENAFKYVSHFTDKCNEIKICIAMKNGQLTSKISNSIERETITSTANSGIGLKNLRRRLELQYPGQHRLEVEKDANHFNVFLALSV